MAFHSRADSGPIHVHELDAGLVGNVANKAKLSRSRSVTCICLRIQRKTFVDLTIRILFKIDFDS